MAELPTIESVFGARKAPNANSTIYSYNAGQEARAAQRVGETISSSAQDLGQIAAQKQKDLEELDLIRAQTFAFKEYATLENEMRNDPDQSWEKYNPLFAQRAQAAASMIKNPTVAEKFRLGLEQDIVQKQILSSEISKKKNDDITYSEFIRDNNAMKDVASKMLLNGDPEGAAVALSQSERRSLAMAKAGVGDWNMTKHEMFMASEAQQNKYDVLVNTYGQDNPEKILDVLSNSKGGFESHIPSLFSVEGGYVAVDGASNNPAIFGINAKYHEAEFNEAKRLNDTVGEKAAKNYAANFYKKNYWDAFKLDDFDPSVQGVLFDAMVNHRAGFRTELLRAAKNGASEQELLSMRKNEYLSLAENPKYRPSLEGWLNRLNKISSGQSVVGNLSIETKNKLIDFANKRLEQLVPQRIKNDIMFASPQEINNAIQKYSGFEDKFSKALEDRNKMIKDDNAGFINQHPSVSVYYDQMLQDPSNPDFRAQYFTAFDGAQDQMGVPAYLRNYIPKAEVEEIQTILKSNPTLDVIQQQADSLRIKYSDRFPEAVSQMRRDKVDPLFIEYAMMSPEINGDQRNSLANAMIAGNENLNKISTVETSVLNDKISDAMSPIQEAWAKGDKTNLTMLAPQKAEAMNLLVRYRLSAGDNIDDAVEYAKNTVLPYQVVDDLVLPKSMTPVQVNNVAITAKAAKENLSLVEIMPPPELIDSAGGIDKVTESLFQEYVQRDVTAVVNGNDILFYDKTGNPLIDKNVLETTGDEFEAIYKRDLSLSASVPLSEEKTSTDLVKMRAEISKSTGGNDLAMTRFNQGFMSRFRSTAIDFYDEKNPVLVKVNPLLKEDIDYLKSGMMTGTERDTLDLEIKKARVNHAYFKEVLNSLPPDARPKLLELAKRSNDAHVQKTIAIKDFKNGLNKPIETGGQTVKSRTDTHIATLKNINRVIDSGIGYNYIELPEWAK